MGCDAVSIEEPKEPEKKLDIPEGTPPLSSFYLYLTSGCNLACRHCWINPAFIESQPPAGEYIDLTLLEKAVEDAKPLGLTSVKLTGGEPLLHPQFRDIITFFKKQEMPVNIETNGTLIDGDMARFLKEKSSVFHLSVSLDSTDADYHDWFRNVSGAFEKTVAGIKHLVDMGYKPQIIMCPHKGNLQNVEDMIRFAESLGVGSVKFNPVSNAGRGGLMEEKGETLGFKEILQFVNRIYNDLQPKYKIELVAMVPPALMSIKQLLHVGRLIGTCRVVNVLGILGSGEMALCGIGQSIPELCFGRLGKDDLRQVWLTHPKLQELREGLAGDLPGICSDCIHSARCQLHCVAQNFLNNGRLISPDPLCSEMDRSGFFPDTRRRSTIDS